MAEVAVDRGSERDSSPHATDQPIAVRRLYRVPEVMELLSMSRSVIYEQIRSGRLRSVTQGRARLIPAAAINDYVNLLVDESRSGHDQPA
jgi:excisionase family DNA binding protein